MKSTRYLPDALLDAPDDCWRYCSRLLWRFAPFLSRPFHQANSLIQVEDSKPGAAVVP
jgi:hypothetical protein